MFDWLLFRSYWLYFFCIFWKLLHFTFCFNVCIQILTAFGKHPSHSLPSFGFICSICFSLSCVVTSIRKPNRMEKCPLVPSANGTKTSQCAEVLRESRNWVNYQEITKYRWSHDLYPRSTLLLVGGCTCHCPNSGSPVRVALHGTG